MANVKFEGLDEFEKWANGAEDEVKKEVAKVLATGGMKIEASAKRNAPVDTGRLRDSINTDISEDGLTVEVGTNVEYAEYVHEGARGRTPKPFMKQAYAQNKDSIFSSLGEALERGLK